MINYIFFCVNSNRKNNNKSKKINIQKIWSGNSWATNTFRALWIKWAAIVLILDILKWFAPIFVVMYFFPHNTILHIMMPIITILWNLFSPYLNFKGWKWISTSIWISFAYDPISTIIILIIWISFIYLLKIVSIVTLSIYLTLAIITYFILPLPIFFSFLIMFFLTLYAHRENIKKIYKWEEKKISFNK
jgi:glycerol-3-phosphate acyltransferase PlsY